MTSTLIGRDEELARVGELVDQAEHGHVALTLCGDPGIGKTSLWVAGLTSAEARGYRVLTSRASEAETRLSYAGVADLVGGVIDEVLPALPPIQRRALERALLLGETEGEADERAVAAAFLATLRILAADRPLCLAIDDLQWLDAASLDAIRFALSRLDAERVASLIAVRGEVPSWLRRALTDDRLTVLELDGLSIGALDELLRERLGTGLPRPTLIRLFETSGGNPFFALELALALERRGFATAPNDPLPIPSRLDELLGERLDALDSHALEVATRDRRPLGADHGARRRRARRRGGHGAPRSPRRGRPRGGRRSAPLHASPARLGRLRATDTGGASSPPRSSGRGRHGPGGARATSRRGDDPPERRDRGDDRRGGASGPCPRRTACRSRARRRRPPVDAARGHGRQTPAAALRRRPLLRRGEPRAGESPPGARARGGGAGPRAGDRPHPARPNGRKPAGGDAIFSPPRLPRRPTTTSSPRST